MPNLTPVRRPAGLTLIELLVALLVLSILITLAVPGIHELLLKQRVRNQSQLFQLALYQARSEAIRRVQEVTLCATDTELRCAAEQRSWSNGWLLFVDHQRNRQFDADDQLLAEGAPLNEGMRLYWNRGRALEFDARGQSVGHNGTFVVCAGVEDRFSRKLILANTGRVRLQSDDALNNCRGYPKA